MNQKVINIDNFDYKQEKKYFSICGYASVYNVVDSDKEIILQNSFQQTSKIKLLWQHDHSEPIGIVESLKDDGYGLMIEASINPLIKRGMEAIELIKQGVINSLSIGFQIEDFHYDEQIKIITKARLLEVSIVTFPSNQLAQITAYKKMNDKILISRPEYSETKDITNFLRHGEVTNKSFSTNESDGGVVLTPHFSQQIINSITNKSPLRQFARVETISTNALEIFLEDEQFMASWVSETQERIGTDHSKIRKKRIDTHELYAQPLATQKFLDDAFINVDSWISDRLSESFTRAESYSFIHGDGINQPRGLLECKDIETLVTQKTGEISFDDILMLQNALPENYLNNAVFLMHRTTIAQIQSITDKNQRYLWQQSLSENQPNTLFGIRVIPCGDMPVFKSENSAIILSDLKSSYLILDRQGMNMMRDPYTEKPFVKFYTTKRVGGEVINPRAAKILKIL